MRIPKSVIVAFLIAVAVALPSAAAESGSQKTTDSGVTVTVTPKNLSREAATWDFFVVLDTHSQELSDDLLKSSMLLDGAGGRYAPIAWDGAAPGGHHREGVLRFKTPSLKPQSIELQIKRNSETAPRSFRWPIP